MIALRIGLNSDVYLICNTIWIIKRIARIAISTRSIQLIPSFTPIINRHTDFISKVISKWAFLTISISPYLSASWDHNLLLLLIDDACTCFERISIKTFSTVCSFITPIFALVTDLFAFTINIYISEDTFITISVFIQLSAAHHCIINFCAFCLLFHFGNFGSQYTLTILEIVPFVALGASAICWLPIFTEIVDLLTKTIF